MVEGRSPDKRFTRKRNKENMKSVRHELYPFVNVIKKGVSNKVFVHVVNVLGNLHIQRIIEIPITISLEKEIEEE